MLVNGGGRYGHDDSNYAEETGASARRNADHEHMASSTPWRNMPLATVAGWTQRRTWESLEEMPERILQAPENQGGFTNSLYLVSTWSLSFSFLDVFQYRIWDNKSQISSDGQPRLRTRQPCRNLASAPHSFSRLRNLL